MCLQWVGQALSKFKDKQVFGRALDSMEEEVGDLMGAWMGMQKLATTPFPFPYAQMCTFFLYLWCYTFPIAISVKLSWFGVVISTIVSYALFGINCVALELEDPFGEETNDLDLDFFEGACMAACKALIGPPLDPSAIESVPGVPGSAAGSPMSLPANSPSPGVVMSQNGAAMATPTTMDPASILAEPGFADKVRSDAVNLPILYLYIFLSRFILGRSLLSSQSHDPLTLNACARQAKAEIAAARTLGELTAPMAIVLEDSYRSPSPLDLSKSLTPTPTGGLFRQV